MDKGLSAHILDRETEKIKTIGNSYMFAVDLSLPTNDSIKNTVLAALEMRVGIYIDPVVVGIVGLNKFKYDFWGDAINTASRRENNSELGKINISDSTDKHLKNDPDFVFDPHGKIEAKGKKEKKMYFVIRK